MDIQMSDPTTSGSADPLQDDEYLPGAAATVLPKCAQLTEVKPKAGLPMLTHSPDSACYYLNPPLCGARAVVIGHWLDNGWRPPLPGTELLSTWLASQDGTTDMLIATWPNGTTPEQALTALGYSIRY